jgi:hypothetical protein
VDVWEIVACEAIRDTVARYAHYADSGRFKDFAGLFAPEGALEVSGEPPLEGRAAIQAFLEGVGADLSAASTVPMIRHHVSNLAIDLVSPTEAHCACYFLAVTEHGVDHWGRYRDRLIPDRDNPSEDRWLFSYRYVKTDGTVPGGWAAGRVNP